MSRSRKQNRFIWLLVAAIAILTTGILATSCDTPTTLKPQPDSTNNVDGILVKQSTPEEAVLSFYQAMNDGDISKMKSLIDENDESSQVFLQGFAIGTDKGISITAEDISIYTIEESESSARIKSNIYMTVRQNGELISESSSGGWFTLIQKQSKWYFIDLGDLSS
ncbi:MAG: hypothetical protein GY746_11295 [Gammaproteobacteria bacterium]|nr:hypothetical protein [Gammaproteobacteria bacterium]